MTHDQWNTCTDLRTLLAEAVRLDRGGAIQSTKACFALVDRERCPRSTYAESHRYARDGLVEVSPDVRHLRGRLDFVLGCCRHLRGFDLAMAEAEPRNLCMRDLPEEEKRQRVAASAEFRDIIRAHVAWRPPPDRSVRMAGEGLPRTWMGMETRTEEEAR